MGNLGLDIARNVSFLSACIVVLVVLCVLIFWFTKKRGESLVREREEVWARYLKQLFLTVQAADMLHDNFTQYYKELCVYAADLGGKSRCNFTYDDCELCWHGAKLWDFLAWMDGNRESFQCLLSGIETCDLKLIQCGIAGHDHCPNVLNVVLAEYRGYKMVVDNPALALRVERAQTLLLDIGAQYTARCVTRLQQPVLTLRDLEAMGEETAQAVTIGILNQAQGRLVHESVMAAKELFQAYTDQLNATVSAVVRKEHLPTT